MVSGGLSVGVLSTSVVSACFPWSLLVSAGLQQSPPDSSEWSLRISGGPRWSSVVFVGLNWSPGLSSGFKSSL